MKIKLPNSKYIREGVRTNKSLEDIRAEALKAEKWERSEARRRALAKSKKWLGKYVGGALFYVLPKWSNVVKTAKFLAWVIAIPIIVALSAAIMPFVVFKATVAEGLWPWELD